MKGDEVMRSWKLARIVIAAIGMALTATAASAQDASWDEVVAKAKEQGRLNIYSVAVPQQMDRLVAAFNEAYPEIQLAVLRGTSELPPRIAAELQTGADGGDVFIFYDVHWFDENKDQLLELASPSAANFPAEGWYIENQAAYLAFSPFGILAWNTDYVKEPLTGHHDLLKPEFAGHIGTREGRDSVLTGYLDFLETELGPDYLRALGEQKPKFYGSGVPLNQALAAGEVWVSNVGLPSLLQDLKDQGAPVAWTTPEPAGFANPWIGSVLKQSKRPEAARVFLDFAMSVEGQSALNGRQSAASPLPGAQDTLDLSKFRILDPKKYTADVIAEWAKKFDDYFRR